LAIAFDCRPFATAQYRIALSARNAKKTRQARGLRSGSQRPFLFEPPLARHLPAPSELRPCMPYTHVHQPHRQRVQSHPPVCTLHAKSSSAQASALCRRGEYRMEMPKGCASLRGPDEQPARRTMRDQMLHPSSPPSNMLSSGRLSTWAFRLRLLLRQLDICCIRPSHSARISRLPLRAATHLFYNEDCEQAGHEHASDRSTNHASDFSVAQRRRSRERFCWRRCLWLSRW